MSTSRIHICLQSWEKIYRCHMHKHRNTWVYGHTHAPIYMNICMHKEKQTYNKLLEISKCMRWYYFQYFNAVVSIGRKIFKLQIIIYSSNLILRGVVWEQFKLHKYLFSLFSTEQGYYGYFLVQAYNNTDLFLYIIFISIKVTNQF